MLVSGIRDVPNLVTLPCVKDHPLLKTGYFEKCIYIKLVQGRMVYGIKIIGGNCVL